MAEISSWPMGLAEALSTLRDGEIDLAGYVPWSSNATLVAEVRTGDRSIQAVYKPRRGERPLRDFPSGTLCLRETAAYVLSQALGWDMVPPTVLRDGPLGFGALQLFVPHDPELHYLVMDDIEPHDVQRIVAFDVIANNADRKSGHVLRDDRGQVWLIDHGLTFHADWKLRTVIWEFAGQPLPMDIARDVAGVAAEVGARESALSRTLEPLLSRQEQTALRRRAAALVDAGAFPELDPERRAFPWPLV